MKKIGIAFSDLHLHDWKSHSTNHSRLVLTSGILRDIGKQAYRDNLPILFCGDLFENPLSLTNFLISSSLLWFKKYIRNNFYGISGNHDLCEKNTFDHQSPSYLEAFQIFDNFYNMDYNSIDCKHFTLHGIPYMNGNNGFDKALEGRRCYLSKDKPNILLIHTDLPGAEDTDGKVVDSSESIPVKMKKFFKGFDLVLSGHIHKPQQLDRNVYMLGAPYQQRSSDKNNELGYWYIMEDLSLKFRPINYMPKFINIGFGETPPDDFNFYIEIPKEAVEEEKQNLTFNNKTPKEKLAKRYLKAKGIKDKDKTQKLIKVLNSVEE